MPLTYVKATDFRCLESVELELDPAANLIVGANASGKTSILEAIAYLGRGRSFLGAPTTSLIRHGQKAFVVFGRVEADHHMHTVGVRNSAEGLGINVDGERSGGAAALAKALPLQVIGPDVHHLVSGGPEQRRRYLDWLAFHVEHGYLQLWRDFRRALKQRNAALKSGSGGAALDGWDAEFSARSEQIATARTRVFEIAAPVLEETASELLLAPIGFELRHGWPEGQTLIDLLRSGRERDLAQGSTLAGPHRADLELRYDQRQARRLVSRGQQKLLACSMILAATEIAQAELESPVLLLLDDPAAELDAESLSRLMSAVNGLGCQVVATALVADRVIFDSDPAVFHVKHGALMPPG